MTRVGTTLVAALLVAGCSSGSGPRSAPRSAPGAETTRSSASVTTTSPTPTETTTPANTPSSTTPVGAGGRPPTSARPTTTAAPSTGGGCPLDPLFPADNAWNQRIDGLPVHARSAAWIASIGASDTLHPDTGSNPDYGIPLTFVDNAPLRPVVYTDYGDESDPGPFPIPPDARIEAGGDRHVLVVDRVRCGLYELYDARWTGSAWEAASGTKWDLRSNARRPDGWTSADAAGLPVAPGLLRRAELASGTLRHALRFTVSTTQRGYIYPATHFASSDTNPDVPPMGARVRLKASFDLSGYRGMARVVLQGLKTYGMLIADNGSDWFISGDADAAWDDDDLNQLKRVPGSAFEFVETGPVRR